MRAGGVGNTGNGGGGKFGILSVGISCSSFGGKREEQF